MPYVLRISVVASVVLSHIPVSGADQEIHAMLQTAL
jgi:hypothetical protein